MEEFRIFHSPQTQPFPTQLFKNQLKTHFNLGLTRSVKELKIHGSDLQYPWNVMENPFLPEATSGFGAQGLTGVKIFGRRRKISLPSAKSLKMCDEEVNELCRGFISGQKENILDTLPEFGFPSP